MGVTHRHTEGRWFESSHGSKKRKHKEKYGIDYFYPSNHGAYVCLLLAISPPRMRCMAYSLWLMAFTLGSVMAVRWILHATIDGKILSFTDRHPDLAKQQLGRLIKNGWHRVKSLEILQGEEK